MKLQRIQLKLYAEAAPDFELSRVVPAFHALIREQKLDEVLIDVADYSHVSQGPGIVLVGHGSDYALELGEGRLGLVHTRKREGPSDPLERLSDTFRRAFAACRLLEADAALGLRFRSDEARIALLDRLETPNDDAAFAAVAPLVERALAAVHGGQPFEIVREGDEQTPLTLRVRSRLAS